MQNLATVSTVVSRCVFGSMLLVGLPNFGTAQIAGHALPAGAAGHFPASQKVLSGPPLGLAATAGAQSAVGQRTLTPNASIPQAKDGRFIEFDVPGSTCKAAFSNCTTPTAINSAGVVTGHYADANGAFHGFLLSTDGTFTLFDGPGATCPSLSSICTLPFGINPEGSITGYYCDEVTCHGFVRQPCGSITTFDPPGSILTTAAGIDPAGTITGSWLDSNFVPHGYLRFGDGSYVSFDVPGDVNGTVPTAIAPSGSVTGTYEDASFHIHGFLRTPDGMITLFDPSGSILTSANSINAAETIAGWYQDATIAVHGFLRSRDGTLATFDVGSSTQTQPASINAAGTVTGNYAANTGFHGFIWDRDGALRTFDPPGSNTTTAFTFANGINSEGVITGWYIDPSFLAHGFIRMPH